MKYNLLLYLGLLLPLGAVGQIQFSLTGSAGYSQHGSRGLNIEYRNLSSATIGVASHRSLSNAALELSVGLEYSFAQMEGEYGYFLPDENGNTVRFDTLFVKTIGWVGLPVYLGYHVGESLTLAFGIQPDMRVHNQGRYTENGFRWINWQPSIDVAYQVMPRWRAHVRYQYGLSNLANEVMVSGPFPVVYRARRLLFGVSYHIF